MAGTSRTDSDPCLAITTQVPGFAVTFYGNDCHMGPEPTGAGISFASRYLQNRARCCTLCLYTDHSAICGNVLHCPYPAPILTGSAAFRELDVEVQHET
jgi:hypothetical protein